MRKNKRGVSPVIATVLLVGIVILMGVIIFMWFKNLQKETITKFGETNVEIVCDEVSFDASYAGGELSISNNGNVPIYSFSIKVTKPGSYETKSISEITTEDWPSAGLNQGNAFSSEISIDVDADSITVIPILLGNSESGEKSFVCDEAQGRELII